MIRFKKSCTTLVVAALTTLLTLPVGATDLSSTHNGALTTETHTQHTEASLLELTTELQAPAPAPAPRKSRHKRSSRRYATGRSRSYGSHYRRRSGGSGFSYDKMEIASSTPALIKSVVDHGQKLLGLRYRTSGVAKWPLDCSGFVSYIYSLEGIKIPRSSSGLAVYANNIKDPQPGDLLFWGDPTNYWHVAIYAGSGTMISADSEASGINEEPIWGTPTLIKRY